MVKGTLNNGFVFEVDEQNCDMRFVEALAKADTNSLLVPKVAEMLLGAEQKEALYKHIADDKGRVPIMTFIACIGEIFDKAGEELKNFDVSQQ